jgi:hypothetical protein
MRAEGNNNNSLGSAAPGNQSTVLSALFRLNAKPLHSMTNQLSHYLSTANEIDTDKHTLFEATEMHTCISLATDFGSKA